MFDKTSEGFVFKSDRSGPTACGPRTALLKNGELICTYMVQTKIGSNDFVPMAAYSSDGEKWSEGKPLWPQHIGKKSAFVSVRPMPDGRVSIAGMWFDISYPGELFWSDEANGMKENKLIWCISDDGKHFPEPSEIEVPYYASAEQPGGMLVRKSGEMMIVYSPCDTIEKREKVDTRRQVILRSVNGGRDFVPGILGTADHQVLFAESWITELGNGLLVSGSWMIDDKKSPDVYFLSDDSGRTFKGPFPMGFFGQTTSFTPYDKDKLLVPYNQRKEGVIGVWLALAEPSAEGFGLIANEPVWEAKLPTRNNTSGDFSEWTDYSFGEPQATILPGGKILVVLWCDQPDGKGIRFIKLDM
jgi:hypothetical protein